MAVYVLASPAPTLWVYPSALHVGTQPPTPSTGGGPIHRRPPPLLKPRLRDDDETVLAILGAI